MEAIFFILWMVVALAVTALSLWAVVRVLHKAGFSGWWVLLLLVPIANIVAVWTFAFARWPALNGGAAAASAPGRAPPPATAMEGADRTLLAQEAPPKPFAGKTWLLSGDGPDGMELAFPISEEDLRRLPDGLLVGRDDSCDCPIPHDSVSRQHARLVMVGVRLGVLDLNSTNGTFVNGRQLRQGTPTALDFGNTVEFGAVRLEVSRG